MQIYATSFPITNELTQDIFINLIIEWNQGSPYNRIENLNWDGISRNVKFEDENLSLSIEELRCRNTIAVRFYQVDKNNVIWTTDIVVDFERKVFSIKLDRETTINTKEFIPKFKPPVLVSMLLERGYVGKDNCLEISAKPIIINKSNYELIECIICKSISCKMPVIYVTKDWGKYPFRVEELSYRLRGVAHVLIEDSVEVSSVLHKTCDGKNAHHGSVGIYYPSNSAPHKIIRTSRYKGREQQLIEMIVRVVCQYVNQQARDKMLTWEGVQNELMNARYASISEKRTQAENEVNEVYKNFGTELEEKERTIKELNNRIIALQAENLGLHAKIDSRDEVPLLFYGLEEEFFAEEIKEQVLDALQCHMKNIPNNCRRKHILLDVVQANENPHKLDIYRERIKKILKGYTKVNDSLKRELKEFGFEIKKDGGHYKLLYQGDSRYMFTMSASGEDSKHGGGNLASEIINLCFK